ncbi:molybdenum cofactor guanylyltransferase [Sphingomonas sp.]
MILGAILAGGASTRFGSDKALALLDGRPLIEHAIAAIAPQLDSIVVCGREWPGQVSLADRPAGRQGPLAGLSAALLYASEHGFDAVLSAPCDTPDAPRDLLDRLSPPSSFVVDTPVIGLWSVASLPVLDALLAADGSRSMRAFADRIAARPVALDRPLRNINRPQDIG